MATVYGSRTVTDSEQLDGVEDITFYLIDASAPLTLTLPSLATVLLGRFYIVKRIDDNSTQSTVTLACNGSDVFPGNLSSLDVSSGLTFQLVAASNGTWQLIGSANV